MLRIRFRLRTIMIVVAVTALVLTVVIQGVLLRRAAVAQQRRAAALQQSAAALQQGAAANRQSAALRQEIEREIAEAERFIARDNVENKKRLASRAEEMAIERERTCSGFKRSIRKLAPPKDETERQGSEND